MIASSMQRFDSEFLAGVRQFTSELADLEKTIPADQLPQAGDAFHQGVLKAFEASQSTCREYEQRLDDEDQLLAAQDYFRTATDPWMRQSWIGNRAREKPSGFSGDYEMLVKLYQQKTPACGLGGYLDLCILDLPLARGSTCSVVGSSTIPAERTTATQAESKNFGYSKRTMPGVLKLAARVFNRRRCTG
jgi:hypothetical protein